jgi:multidrug resistance efflux pump
MKLCFAFALLTVGLSSFAQTDAKTNALADRPVILSGEVQAADSQSIIVPPSNSSPTVVRFFVPEGQAVKKGDVVLRIDASTGGGLTEVKLQQQLEQAKVRAARELSNHRVSILDAEIALAQAHAALAKSVVDAALPQKFLSTLDYDRYQNEAKRAVADYQQKQRALEAARLTADNAARDFRVEQETIAIDLAYTQSMKSKAEVIAQQDGIVVHGYSEWRGRRIDEGESVQIGNEAGKIISGAERAIVAWALEADRNYLSVGQQMSVFVDALHDRRIDTVIKSISDTPEPRSQWGTGQYFTIRLELNDAQAQGLVPGMSIRVEPRVEKTTPAIARTGTKTLQLEGEIGARVRSFIAPPTIPDIWQHVLMMLVPEGTQVEAQQVVAKFDDKQVRTQLESNQLRMEEVNKQLAQLKLNHAESERQIDISTQEAKANVEKAERKAAQPAELIKRIDYDKLVIDKKLSIELYALMQAKQTAQANSRAAELKEKLIELSLLSNESKDLELAMGKTTVRANNPGVVIHGQAFNGDKFTSGSQVFQGLSVATVADTRTLRVEATVSEADSALVAIGQSATVRFGTAGSSITAKVSELGSMYRRKGRSQPTIVRDVLLELPKENLPAELKPGLAIQVTLDVEPAKDVLPAQAGIQGNL